MVTTQDLEYFLQQPEGKQLEFKEARNNFDTSELLKYIASIANEGGGEIILGVSDKIPRSIVGTRAFLNDTQILHKIRLELNLSVSASELDYQSKRVLVFSVPSCILGNPIRYKGRYLERSGESVTDMSHERLLRMLSPMSPDFSAETCSGATIHDLDISLVRRFARKWSDRGGPKGLSAQSPSVILERCELRTTGKLTYAAVILFAKPDRLRRFLPNAEIVGEYRNNKDTINYADRVEFHEPALSTIEQIWDWISSRNQVTTFQDNLFRVDVPSFDEAVIREALINAVSHRDYRMPGSIFIRQAPEDITIKSPGWFPDGIDTENIFHHTQPRNRRLAESLQRCGLVERSGQGVAKMFKRCISQGKRPPVYADTGGKSVHLTIQGAVEDASFISFLNKLQRSTSVELKDLLILDAAHRGVRLPKWVKRSTRVRALLEAGAIEQQPGKRGLYMLSSRYFNFTGRPGSYTHYRGLDVPAQKALLLQHLKQAGADGCAMKELLEVLPGKSRYEVRRLLRGLQELGKVRLAGERRSSKWHFVT